MFKGIILLSAIFIATKALACPELKGTFTCTLGDKNLKIDISGPTNGNEYIINGYNGDGPRRYVATGQREFSSGLVGGQKVDAAVLVACDGDTPSIVTTASQKNFSTLRVTKTGLNFIKKGDAMDYSASMSQTVNGVDTFQPTSYTAPCTK